ncbi:MAG: PQQ-dependent sugar dehydrogenase [Phycisphaerales bacterium]
MSLLRSVVLAVSLSLSCASVSLAQTDYGNLIDVVTTGLSSPVGIYACPGDDTRLFVVEQGGRIRIINVTTDGSGNKTYALTATPFLDLAALDATNPFFRNASNVPLQDQSGTVIPRIIRNGGATVPNNGNNYAVSRGGEQGLLSMAFHPDYAANGKFYIYYTMNAPDASGNITWSYSGNGTSQNPYVASTGGQDVIFEFQRDPANPAAVLASSERRIIGTIDPYTNHNGAQMIFGRDGYLYIAIGDGGNGGDPGDRAGNPNVLLGKMLRLDVNSDAYPADSQKNYAIPPGNPYATGGGAPEVWARGLRNPWRWSFDRWNGDLWIGDVGQDLWEEIDHVSGNGGPGLHYGWRAREGLVAYTNTAYTATYTNPVYVFPHSAGQAGTNSNWTNTQVGVAVVGGYVYRGNAIRGWRGKYIFSDTYGNQIWAFDSTVAAGAGTPAAVGLENWSSILRSTVGGVTPSSIANVVSFGEDNDGELFVVQIGGRIRKIVPQNAQPAIADVGRQGGLPGSDGAFDNNDFIAFINLFFANDPRATSASRAACRASISALTTMTSSHSSTRSSPTSEFRSRISNRNAPLRKAPTLKICCALVAAALAAPAIAQDYGNLQEIVTSGLSDTVGLFAAPGDDTRLFVIERVGRVRVINITTGPTGQKSYAVRTQPFLDIRTVVNTSYIERGLLGLAFAPDYATTGFFYVNYTDLPNGSTRIVRFRRDSSNPDAAIVDSRYDVLTIPQPYANHNGGNIIFGRDGYLYIGMGDGGSGNDPGDRALNPSNLLGKMLRIDVARDDFPDDPARNYGIPTDNPYADGVNGAPEVWARGLRNPWRWSFDRWNGDLWIGDVGQDEWEEIDRVPGNGGPGRNYGWRVREGNTTTSRTSAFDTSAMTPPLYVYPHGAWGGYTQTFVGNIVLGGFVYRGNAIRPWRGKYFFADTGSGRIWAFNADAPQGDGSVASVGVESWSSILLSPPAGGGVTPPSVSAPVSFGEDNDGEIYLVEQSGRIRKIVPQNTQPPIADVGGVGGLVGADGQFDNNDFIAFITLFFANNPKADMGKTGGLQGVDQRLDNNDFIAFINAFFTGR